MKKHLRHCLAIVAWVVIWLILWLVLPKNIHFAGPIEVIQRLYTDIRSQSFWIAIWTTYSGIIAGFFLALIIGSVWGYLAYYFERFKIFMTPAMDFIRYIPMISFTLLAIIWSSASLLVFEVSLFLALPVIYRHTYQALLHDNDEELKAIWKKDMPLMKKLDKIYRPATMPEYIVGCHRAINMCCKSGILAQFLGGASHSVAKSLSVATDNLDVAGIFSWTIVIVVISIFLERCIIRLLSLTIINETDIDVESLMEQISEDEEMDL